jgi:CRP/FNR family transcriptional regulator, cyclic AMP receptor protein
MMESLQNILAEHPFTHGLEERHLAFLTGCAAIVRFEAGQRIFGEGEEANQFYLVRESKLVIELVGAERAHSQR